LNGSYQLQRQHLPGETNVNPEAALARQQKILAQAAQQQAIFNSVAAQQAAITQQSIAANDNATTSSSHLGDALRVSARAVIDYTSSWLATAGAVGAGLLAFGSILGILAPIILAYKATKASIDLVSEAWELGGQKLEEYRQIAQKAAAVDLSTSYFQKLTAGAEASKVPVDQLMTALQNLQKSSADTLGGSALQNRLDASVKAGNFAGNPGVDQLAQANTLQEKFTAITTLVHNAMQDGQRLAAIDITGTAFGPEMANNLRNDSEYFDKLVTAAANVPDVKIVSDADVGNAQALKVQWDAAVSILEQRWHPIQDIMTQAGINMQANWVAIVSSIATAADNVAKLVEQIGKIPTKFWNYIQNGANALGSFFVNTFTTPESRSSAEQSNGITSDPAAISSMGAQNEAQSKLTSGLQNYYNVMQQVTLASNVANKARGDTSHAIDDQTSSLDDQANAYTRALNSAQKHYAEINADTDAVGLGVGALAEFKTSAALLTAAQQAQIPITQKVTDQINAYSKAAGVAAQANALVKANSAANFASQTLFMSPTDLAAANVMHNLYGDDWQSHMDDALAKQLKMNSEIGAAKSLTDQLAGSFANDLVSGLLAGKTGMEALTSAANNLGKSLTTAGINNIIKNPTDPTGYIEAGAGIIDQMLTGDSQAKKDLEAAQAQWAAMANQVIAFNQAAAGFNLGPLTSQIQQLSSTEETLMEAAVKAKDLAGASQIGQTFNQGVARIVDEFEAGTQTLTPLQTAIKGVNDEAQGLHETLANLNLGGLTLGIDAAAAAQIQALVAQYTDQLTTGLTQRLNTAQGKDYLNSAQDVLTQHQTDLSNAAELGNSPALMAQISATFAAEAQKVVNDAGLVGDQFNDFIKLFPDFAGVVTQSATAIQAANDNFAALTKTINDYLDSLQLGSNSILSPQDQLNAAQSQFNAQLSLAQKGNTDALGSITQYASTLLDQAKSYYASSEGYTDIYSAVTDALKALTTIPTPGLAMGGIVHGYANGGMIGNGTFGVDSVIARYAGGGSIALAGGEYVMPAAQTQAHLPMLEAMRRGGSSNDNGNFAALGQQFTQAIAAACSADINAMNAQTDALRAELRGLRTAIEGNKPKSPRPNAKAA
jgi:hypothetical protein